jgi:maltoporin
MRLHKIYLALLGLLAAPSLFAQSPGKQVTEQQLIWYAYNNTLELSSKWSLTSEVHERRFRKPDEQHQFQVASRLNYNLGKNWSASVAFIYFLQSPHDPHATDDLVVPELRPYIQSDYRQPLGRLTIGHRYRIEKRFFRNTADGELAEGYNTNYRFRYRLGLEYQVASIRDLPLKVKVSNEIHLNAGKRIVYNRFDQNRIYIGLNQSVQKNINVEVGYLKWYQQRAAGNQFYSRDIINLALYHKIDLKKKETAAAGD